MENKTPKRIRYKGQIYEAVEMNGVSTSRASRRDLIQLKKNIKDILAIHLNGVYDGVEDDFETEEEAIRYVRDRVFDQKTINDGWTQYGDGICKNLKFLGDGVINDTISNIWLNGDF